MCLKLSNQGKSAKLMYQIQRPKSLLKTINYFNNQCIIKLKTDAKHTSV
jgi:hypothetical protein